MSPYLFVSLSLSICLYFYSNYVAIWCSGDADVHISKRGAHENGDHPEGEAY